MMDGVPVIDPAKVPGVMYFLPVPKSPHGIDTDPSGRWIVGIGKLAPVVERLRLREDPGGHRRRSSSTGDDARRAGASSTRAVLEGEVPVGLGPLHTQYDGKGNAYTSLFVESAGGQVEAAAVDGARSAPISTRSSATRSRCTSTSATWSSAAATPRQPYGQYLVAMNKLSKGRHLSVGPSQPESEPAHRHHRQEDDDALRGLHRAGAALRPDPQGRRASSRSRSIRRPRTRIRMRCGPRPRPASRAPATRSK